MRSPGNKGGRDGAVPAGKKTLLFKIQHRGLKQKCWVEGTCRNYDGLSG